MRSGTFRGTRPIVGTNMSRIGGAVPRPVYAPIGGTWLLGIAFVSGIIVLVSAIMLNKRPEQATRWGVLTLIFSVASFFGGFGWSRGGFFIGAILGIVGGALALLSKPKG
jgi:hypothetical protein